MASIERVDLDSLQRGDVFYMGQIHPNMGHPYEIINIRYYVGYNYYDCRDIGGGLDFGMQQKKGTKVWIWKKD